MRRGTIVFVASLTAGTGNSTTAKRITKSLEKCNFDVRLVDCNSFADSLQLQTFVLSIDHVVGLVGVHLFRTGRLFLAPKLLGIPLCMILGGTDVNEHFDEAAKRSVMEQVVARSRIVIAFTEAMRSLFLKQYPNFDANDAKTIFPSVNVCPVERKDLPDSLKVIYDRGNYLLLVSGIREVKDPCYLIDAVEQRAKETLVICGPILKEDIGQAFLQKLQGKKHCIYVGNHEIGVVHTLIKNALALVNCSLSEGLSNALLEALALGCPVVARDIPGNAAVIEEGKNGFLFRNPKEFCEKLDALRSFDRSSMKSVNDAEKEASLYQEAVEAMIGEKG